ncbi:MULTISPECIES: GH25 family lysozyme [unclassified Streptomyces]|uniref:GH25 family lysozyme n=1 Tax=unclassified Streptomyces TaxID=2593676 RepID=UPI000B831ADA|nr:MULTISPECIES: GH25 family lysozyme [unclassified Streptomyces]MYS21863.1 lysozyme [Streptomyces sp. SID4948]
MTAGVLGVSLALAATVSAGTASAQPAARDSAIPLGQGYMGAGYLQDGTSFAPDTRHLHLDARAVASPNVTYPAGIDVSHYQGTITWTSVKSAGIQFAFIKATESTTYKDPDFSANYLHAYNAKVIRGAYHFARPDLSSGAAQATYFAANGGAWSADGLTLPGMLDLEGGCYSKSTSAMQSWILDFYTTYKAKTGRDILIYTSPSWWNSCTGGWSGMSAKSPLVVANWTDAASPSIPSGFPYWTFWQYSDSGSVSGVPGAVDRDRFSADSSRLLALANNTP